MSGIRITPNTIHLAANADFDNYAYFEVYAGADTTAVINGESVTMGASSRIEIKVSSISGANVYVLGAPKNNFTGVSYSGTSNAPQLGGSAFLD